MIFLYYIQETDKPVLIARIFNLVEIIDDKIISKIYEKKTINRNELKQKSSLIKILIVLAFIFDINYQASYEIIRNEKYIDKIFQKFNFKNEDTKKKMKKVQEFLNQYIDDKYNS